VTLPVIALVGRPNVGKSTLFNYLTRTRDALVADYPGLTRDRQFGRVRRGNRGFIVVDTGGIKAGSNPMDALIEDQVDLAIQQSDIVLFLVDAREGLNVLDQSAANELRKKGKPVLLIVNKADGIDSRIASLEFYALALGTPLPISASHGTGVGDLLDQVNGALPQVEPEISKDLDGIGIAVVGRPNVGKSTLVNRLLGEERVVVFDQPGTTRDSISIPFDRGGQSFVLIDTAGMRRRARISEKIEKFSVIKAMQAIDKANVVIYLVDASEGVTDQDATLMGFVLDAGRALVIGLNKWDGLKREQKNNVRRQIDLKLPFLDFAQKHPISALHGSGVGKLFDVIQKIYAASMVDMSSSALTRILGEAGENHQPPMVRGRRIKLKYAHQGGHNPPVVVVHGNQTDRLPTAYKRYLVNFFREKLGLEGTPIRLEFKTSENPFKGQKNRLTEYQLKKRKRMVQFAKK